MQVELGVRTRENVIIYFYKTQDVDIKKLLPMKAQTLEEALLDYEKSLLPSSTSYGESIYVDGTYVGDVWCYCLGNDDPDAMLSFCIFEKNIWGCGVAKTAASLFLNKLKEKFSIRSVGAFTYSYNVASQKVLCAVGFKEIETFEEDGIESKYFQIELNTEKRK